MPLGNPGDDMLGPNRAFAICAPAFYLSPPKLSSSTTATAGGCGQPRTIDRLPPIWARLARLAPRVVNAGTASRILAPAVKRLGGVAAQRQIPRFATRSFRQWFMARQPPRPAPARPVLLWVDTFTDNFTPEVGVAAVAVLESAGYQVRIPPGNRCCGLTWISPGQLGLARRVAARSLDTIAPSLSAGMPSEETIIVADGFSCRTQIAAAG